MSANFPILSEPKTSLGHHRLLSSRSSVRVSPLCLGAMQLGTAWNETLNSGLDEKESHDFLDAWWDKGGNFIDTANAYTRGESERILGSWMTSRKNREEIVLATKFTARWRDQRDGARIMSNFTGNSTKSLRHSLDASLRNLQTNYVDVLYVHLWDWSTSIPELMQALHREVTARRVDYLGVSDTPAWVVAAANEYANANALTPFVVYQGKWNALDRDLERDILPMCRHYGMAIAPWAALGQGRFRTPEQLAQREKEFGKPVRGGGQSDEEARIARTLDEVAKEVGQGATITQIALAYCFAKSPYVFPIVGGTKLSYIDDNIRAIDLRLTPDQLAKIEAAAPLNKGFPYSMTGDDNPATGAKSGAFSQMGGPVDFVKGPTSMHLEAKK
ncbi:putative AAD14-putative aryl-alcohol reductase [Jaminaea rosea]|uniref:Putative AAD14-putative aryl-alcohol reductase n=1 Tax=Jaminaea rosea TaxID=1569628 RepID=A0A316UJM5_9BASI|nr:putative AAD14-putative aryl-alcohol reductase [Jaminaea rosea]PWN25420.1 putative AAD14-putative aryl-alcohol reductase [Jaminaea rosea]